MNTIPRILVVSLLSITLWLGTCSAQDDFMPLFADPTGDSIRAIIITPPTTTPQIAILALVCGETAVSLTAIDVVGTREQVEDAANNAVSAGEVSRLTARCRIALRAESLLFVWFRNAVSALNTARDEVPVSGS
ncbi:hypothetical protein BWQ96_08667 [Gracilariopsis chorda]|uniref:Uncharacterized protein n=1 Tax=Gracilariopsis chorda TaxID=448386 RepID=A0A2V3IHT6_9FLOR|nr:hypothetical protein BWQ96_08667 [Gracilariopsis chorda]|eukprot:PXF41656.1 hypothetical protein BWQ96_08667 [Gracilariopsis chorda]